MPSQMHVAPRCYKLNWMGWLGMVSRWGEVHLTALIKKLLSKERLPVAYLWENMGEPGEDIDLVLFLLWATLVTQKGIGQNLWRHQYPPYEKLKIGIFVGINCKNILNI